MNPKLSATVSVVPIADSCLEFFKTNTRRSVVVRCSTRSILKVLDLFDGTLSLDEIAERCACDLVSLRNFVAFLQERGVLDNVEDPASFEGFERFRRTIYFLNDYSRSPEHLKEMWGDIRTSNVLIVGLGAVGSWIACNLVQSGVRHLTLMDPDVVELSNLHRQFGFRESDIGRFKVDVLSERLLAFEPGLKLTLYKSPLEESTLESLSLGPVDLMINCADKPNVDTTSRWIGRYGIEHGIPHIIGGGYNLHISLVGQTVVPRVSACVKCFEKSLSEENAIVPGRVKKLERSGRKIGSFGPMCALVASMTGMEALKILTKSISPANMNRRGEFDISTMQLSYRSYPRRLDCEWCAQ